MSCESLVGRITEREATRPLLSTPRRFLGAELRDSIWRPMPAIDAMRRCTRRARNDENRYDFAQALALVDGMHLERLLRETEREIAEHWSQVEAVAAALLEREFLPALELHRIIIAAR